MEAENSVFKLEKVKKAVDGMISVISECDLTVPESILAVRSLDYALKGEFSELYSMMERGDVWGKQ